MKLAEEMIKLRTYIQNAEAHLKCIRIELDKAHGAYLTIEELVEELDPEGKK